MRKSNTKNTRSEQVRTELALKRRTKRKAIKAAIVAPYIRQLEARDLHIAELLAKQSKSRIAVPDAPNAVADTSEEVPRG